MGYIVDQNKNAYMKFCAGAAGSVYLVIMAKRMLAIYFKWTVRCFMQVDRFGELPQEDFKLTYAPEKEKL